VRELRLERLPLPESELERLRPVSLLPLPLRLLLPRQAIPHRRQAITDPLPFQQDVFGFDDLFRNGAKLLLTGLRL
jgi:hypothetical protein